MSHLLVGVCYRCIICPGQNETEGGPRGFAAASGFAKAKTEAQVFRFSTKWQ